MGSIQSKPNLLNLMPKMSIFDKKGQANLARITKLSNMPQRSEVINIPAVRINQHKGA